MSYDTLSPADLVALLDQVGQSPDPNLMRVCLARGAEISPNLLARIHRGSTSGAGEDLATREKSGASEAPETNEDDLLTFGEIHAALLLIALREPAALPYFDRVFRDEASDYLLEWYTVALPLYGKLAVPLFSALALDDSVYTYGRTAAIDVLEVIAGQDANEREGVVATLRALLPHLDERNRIAPADLADPDRIELLNWVVMSLGALRDGPSRRVVKALADRKVFDPTLVGSRRELMADFDVAAPAPEPALPYDLVDDYQHLFEQAERAKARREEKGESSIAYDAFGSPQDADDFVDSAEPQRPHVRSAPKIGRNEPCPCGSGKKYKKCCLSKDEEAARAERVGASASEDRGSGDG